MRKLKLEIQFRLMGVIVGSLGATGAIFFVIWDRIHYQQLSIATDLVFIILAALHFGVFVISAIRPTIRYWQMVRRIRSIEAGLLTLAKVTDSNVGTERDTAARLVIAAKADDWVAPQQRLENLATAKLHLRRAQAYADGKEPEANPA